MVAADNKVILITGASSGLGLSCARHLAQRGYHVWGTSRHRQPEGSAPFTWIQMDVDDEDSVRQGVAEVLKQAGRLDVVVNNAGFGVGGAIEDTPLDEARAQFETNFFGVLRVCQAVLPGMRAQRSGLIVNISSLGGIIALPFQGLYSAAKYAVEGLSEALRMEMRPWGIHVVLVEPADFRTGFTARRRAVAGAQDSPYAAAFERALAVIEYDENHGSSPEMMDRLLERIIRSRSPRLRYTVGAFTELLAGVLKPYLPQRLFEWIIRGHYKL
jgi:NAD(P)-dependent dehydrogenase (short-subunit alcohol dehydrogenase family)